jgi:tRNA nucleotidyltransferase (CCA-adding enzyme)
MQFYFMDVYQKVLNEALKLIIPKQEDVEKLKYLSQKALEIANEEMKKYEGKAILAGSITRDTWLPDKKEFDVFLLFPKNFINTELEEVGLAIGKEIIKRLRGSYVIEYAQHPYVSGKIEDVEVDIVPCYEISTTKEIKSSVDRTPFHVKYIEENLHLDLSSEVRLLKQFCKANGIYGSDAKTQGLSGYACEILIIHYGKFIKLIKDIVNWKLGEIIDTEKFYDKKDYKSLRFKFKNEALIIIDPTDKKRNVTSALSIENFFKLKKIAKQFLENPSVEFFIPKKIKPLTDLELKEYLAKRNTELIVLKFTPPNVVPDILWPQLRKFADRLESILEETKYEFKVLRKGVYTNEKDLAIVLLEMEISKLPNVQKRIGPSVFDFDDSNRFIEKYKDALNGPFIEDGKWVVEIERMFLTARDKLVHSLKKDLETLKAKGIPNYIAEQLVKGFRIFSDVDVIAKILNEDEGFAVFLRKYFKKEKLV